MRVRTLVVMAAWAAALPSAVFAQVAGNTPPQAPQLIRPCNATVDQNFLINSSWRPVAEADYYLHCISMPGIACTTQASESPNTIVVRRERTQTFYTPPARGGQQPSPLERFAGRQVNWTAAACKETIVNGRRADVCTYQQNVCPLTFPGVVQAAGVQSATLQFRGRTMNVEYEAQGDLQLLEGDIEINIDDIRSKLRALETTPTPTADLTGGLGFTKSGLAAVLTNKLWPNATVPFEIHPDLANTERVTDAIAKWESMTPLRFVPRDGQRDYIRFKPHSSQCSSRVGRDGGRQDINLADDCQIGQVLHEIGHAIGLFHEQSREDRDNHIKILWDNIKAWKGHNFRKYSEDDFLFWGSESGRDLGPYDFVSIMHYGSSYFAKDYRPTILRRYGCKGDECIIDGQRNRLSANDVRYVHEMYCPMLSWDGQRCRNYYPVPNSFAFRIVAGPDPLGAPQGSSQPMCIDVADASRNNQAAVNRYPCHTDDNQLFFVEKREDGYFTIRNKHSGLCLDIPGGTSGRSGLQQFACHGGDNQKWRLQAIGGAYDNSRHGYHRIQTKTNANLCLGFDGASNSLKTTTCGSNAASGFTFVVREAPKTWNRLVNQGSGGCIDVPFSSTGQTPLQTFTCSQDANQLFRLTPKADDTFSISASHSQMCAGVSPIRTNFNTYTVEQTACPTVDQATPHTSFYLFLKTDGDILIKGRERTQCLNYAGPGRLEMTACGAGGQGQSRNASWAVSPAS